MGYFFLALTVLLTAYGQLLIKWQLDGKLPDGIVDKATFLRLQLLNPWISSGFVAFLAAYSWVVAMTQLPLYTAYTFASHAIVLVLVGSYFILDEELSGATRR